MKVHSLVKHIPNCITPILYVVFSLFFSACSMHQTKDLKQLNEVNKEAVVVDENKGKVEQQYVEKILAERLQKLSEQAKKSGPYAVNYLATDIFFKADEAARVGDYELATLFYKHLTILYPKDNFIKMKYSVGLIRQGKLEDAREILSGLFRKTKGKQIRAGLILAGIHTALSDKEKARRVYRKILKFAPKTEDACLFLSKSYALDAKYKLAFRYLDRCQRAMPDNGSFALYKGKIYLEQSKKKLALKFFKKALKIDPDYSQAALAIGIFYENEKKYRKAINHYKKYLVRDSYDEMILSRLVQLYFLQERYDESLVYLENLSNIEPENINLKLKLGILYSDAKKYKRAKRIFTELLKVVPDKDRILYYLGALAQKMDELEEAYKYYSLVPVQSVLYNDSMLQVGYILKSLAILKKTDSDEEFLYKFLEKQEKNNPDLKSEMVFIRAGYYEEIDQVDRAIDILEEYKEKEERLLYYLASLYEKQHDYSSSIKVILKLVEINPKHAHAWNFLGYSVLERDKDFKKAFEYITKAVSLEPDDGFIRDSLGWYYYKKGMLRKALKELKLARKSVGDDPIISRHLAIVYQELKLYDKAEKYFNEALQNAKHEQEKADVLRAMQEFKQKRYPASHKKK